jgi:hypothetical protein
VVMRAYFDRSGKKENGPIVTVGGFFAEGSAPAVRVTATG